MKAARVTVSILGVLFALLGLVALIASLTGSGAELTIAVVLGLIFLGLGAALLVGAYYMRDSRPCPRCAKGVRKGVVVCPTCGYDFS